MKRILTVLWLLHIGNLFGQQVSDHAFQYKIVAPRYETAPGSIIMVDAAHNNYHTSEGRYAPFAKLLRQDGYQVLSNENTISASTLEACKVFVISNPLNSINIGSWQLPTPSAFSPEEIKTVNAWVKSGGSLLLIADHMPFAGAAADLAQSFGFEYLNCFAMDNRRRGLDRFYKANQTLLENEITAGIDTVVTFTGSAFRIPKVAKGILALRDFTLLSPTVAWQFEENTLAKDCKGYYQGAYMNYGAGRVVVMGEAAMFSAQLAGPNQVPVGMNSPNARGNPRLLLNIMHWLDN